MNQFNFKFYFYSYQKMMIDEGSLCAARLLPHCLIIFQGHCLSLYTVCTHECMHTYTLLFLESYVMYWYTSVFLWTYLYAMGIFMDICACTCTHTYTHTYTQIQSQAAATRELSSGSDASNCAQDWLLPPLSVRVCVCLRLCVCSAGCGTDNDLGEKDLGP